MKGCASANGALDMDFSCVLLNDAIGDAEPESSAAAVTWLGRGLGGKEWIVDALEVLRSDARAGVSNHGGNMTVHERGNTETASAWPGFLDRQRPRLNSSH